MIKLASTHGRAKLLLPLWQSAVTLSCSRAPVPAATSVPQRAPARGGAAPAAVTAGTGRSRRGAAAASLQGQGRFARAGTVTARPPPRAEGTAGETRGTARPRNLRTCSSLLSLPAQPPARARQGSTGANRPTASRAPRGCQGLKGSGTGRCSLPPAGAGRWARR